MSIAITNLDQRPSLLDETISLIEKSFTYKREHRFAIDFAPLIKNNLQNLYIAIADDVVIGHVGLLPRELKVGIGQSYPVALLGGISVHKDFRGQGVFQAIFDNILNDWNQTLSLYMLWGDKIKLYQKFGFYLTGGIVQSKPQGNGDLERWQETRLKDIGLGDFEQIKNLYRHSIAARYNVIVREDEDWEVIKSITSARLFVRRDEAGQVMAYFFKNKGEDLANIIYEIGFSSSLDIVAIVGELAGCAVWMPEDWQGHLAGCELYPLAFFKLASVEKFTSLVHAWSGGRVVVSGARDGLIHYQVMGRGRCSSFQQLLALIWGPDSPQEFRAMGSPLFISGLDSV